ncbi:Zn(2+)-responsive transcriptional regulator [Marinomonas mediterranea]|jgi:transcriptional regulator, MerR family|uniref:Transcriptional regulator, MerR family n=1 Tax=Marinomonas mediterranea (strain ATCC 700492 / JCM 21426 / NBRC 103028 / MMB-1) TaxID=717774 RepID=F2JW54_MARM1|nr:Zn(2+)-responsive transcriptional regulator [Marinomonas mediterranea]ADZ89442.1 transcriptional regulator, MerR family [Marinomonas mediterranea MMB-1]WCN07538.1 Zn(2+)-responsive transcriptional regulator [Marinomonas mediterranea]WCN11636.1 Zn(2+)-responsive transcriptional regulator [Marinomonas mediterranea]WCN15695.1 Zn(2+)-responsive transcriptional regulator [Marinomonas mediterranea MMB-1]
MDYQIGALAKRLGVSADTLRFYEKNGLLAPSKRSESGYRLYSDKDQQTLSFILRAKSVGFSLAEIKELISLDQNKVDFACGDVKELVDLKRAQIQTKISELQAFERSLRVLSDACCGGDESALNCSILQTLEDDGGLYGISK